MTEQSNQPRPVDVIWCSPHPNHYNTFLFDRLASVAGMRLSLVYFDEKLAIYPWKSSFHSTIPVAYLRRGRGGVDWAFLRARLRSPHELLVVAGWNEPTMLLLLLCFSALGRPFLIWTDTPNPRPRPGLRQRLRGGALAFIFRHVTRYLVTGAPGVENARQLGVPAAALVNFPFATDTDLFRPADPARPESDTVVCISSGRLDIAHKAYDVAIEAFALVKARHPRLRFRYVVAGEGPDRALIERLIADRDLGGEVELRGWLEPADLPGFYHSGDVFVHASNFDPFPNAVLEAMASGLPVVGSLAAGSVKDRVVDGENGYVHPAGDVETLAAKLATILGLPVDARRALGRRARETALRWHVDYHAGVMRQVLDDVRAIRGGHGTP
jgi:glycosyltransferase involved in cell wall biosynthesis